ncbi:MAG: MBL fold metallo-hydrolase [Dehalococcoidia bacterium]|nr:MBL fold metallo-hydrolase [Dehalococcoidia bacterium]
MAGDDLRVIKIGPLGPHANNAYVIIDGGSGESLIVDMPAEGEKVLEQAQGTKVMGIVLTHAHPDHRLSFDLMTKATGAPVMAHVEERGISEDKVTRRLSDEETLSLGSQEVKVIHTPGHTPGSICLLAGEHLIAGDTLFPGGPGHTGTPQQLQQVIRSIIERLFALPDDTLVCPGHGENTTIGRAKQEYAVFASRQHPPDLCGDVTWEGS